MQGLPSAGPAMQLVQIIGNNAVVRLPNGQMGFVQNGAQQLIAQQQQALLQQQQQAAGLNPAFLGPRAGQPVAATASQQPNAAAVLALQQRLAQAQGIVPARPGAAGAVAGIGSATNAQQQQQLLQALQQQQAANAARQAAAVTTPIKPQMGFTQEQLLALKDQIMLFKLVKKGNEVVTKEALDKCKPPPLPVPAPIAQPQDVLPVAAVAGAVRPAALPTALQQHVRPQQMSVAVQQQQQLQAAQLQVAQQQQLQAAQQQQLQAAQQQQLQAAQQQQQRALAQQRAAAPAGGGQPGRQGQPAAGGTVAQQAVQLGPSTPPMDVPVRRWLGPVLAMVPAPENPGAGAPPSLNVDVPRMLAKEYHHRLGRSRARRQHELEQLLKRTDLPVGHGRSPEGLPGRAAVMLELRKLRLQPLQHKARAVLEREQEEIANMQERNYRQLQKTAARYKQQLDLSVQQKQHETWERLFIERVQYKKVVADRFIMYRDMHLTRNKQLGRLHERLARELNKQKMDDNDRRLEALKANDFEAYKELLRQTYGPVDDDDRYAEVERFLRETEEYINKLTKKLVQYKAEEQAGDAVQEAIAEARMLELSEEEVKARAAAAQQEHMATNELLSQVHTLGGDAQSRFTQLAHNIREKVTRQPAYLKPPKSGKLREYQMVGLEWMVSLYNNKLNGILADEMGLGKTVQVMALLAYLYEFKQNYGPHLIIVPNAVIVNWKAELQTWLPDFRCVYYTGSKEERAVKFQNEVQSMQFNILVTTYETIMRDRSKLSKLEWKYIIIDEAQRMKDRESKLSQDLNKFTTARRLLLTGTPLQNELKELWSLLNLLLPDVFNDSNTFSEWFTRFLGVDTFGDAGSSQGEAAALDREKKILVVNRLHQILSPFMLRRMVKDVEQQLPEKITITIKCPMSAYQCAVYNWIKTTNTIRVDPKHRRAAHGQRAWEPLQNKVMELRKVCNHPRLCYQDTEHFWGADVVRMCGKMFWLDRMLVKLHASGHRVLLFSTMTKMLDTVEFYLNWRQVEARDGSGRKVLMQSRRIDGGTTLEAREAAIQEFNRPNSDTFIFLLSIRAAGRGLNLQTADTVIIYDPDPNPKNEEQAIARSHRIGQTKEVRVFHLEAICDPADSFPPPYYQPRRGDTPAAAQQQQQPSLFSDSIESLMRNIIQKQKIDMANEVIDAGRFDMQTTNEERRKTLEEMLLDEDRLQTATNEAPTFDWFNRQLARSSAEYELFTRLDQEAEWPGELNSPQEVPEYLQYSASEAQEVLQITDRRPARVGMLATAERRAQGLTGQDAASGRGRGRGRGRSSSQAAVPLKPSRLGPAGPGAPATALSGQGGMQPTLSASDLAGGSGAVGGGMRPSQSMGSFLGATSYVSGMGEEGEGDEEVVGGADSAFEDIEEEVVDDRNIDEEFEKALEQAEDLPGAVASAGAEGAGVSAGQQPQSQQQEQQQLQREVASVGPAAAVSSAAAAAPTATAEDGTAALYITAPGLQQPASSVAVADPAAGDGGMQPHRLLQQAPQKFHTAQDVSFQGVQQQPSAAAAAAAALEARVVCTNGSQSGTAAAGVAAPTATEEEDWEDVDNSTPAAVVAAAAWAPNMAGDLAGSGSLMPGTLGTAVSWGAAAGTASGSKRNWEQMSMPPAGASAAATPLADPSSVWQGVSGDGQVTNTGMAPFSQENGPEKQVKLEQQPDLPQQ